MKFERLLTQKFKKRFNRLMLIDNEAKGIRYLMITDTLTVGETLQSLKNHDALREIFNEEKYWWMSKMKRVDVYGGLEN